MTDRAGSIEMWPGGPTFRTGRKPVISPNSPQLEADRQRDYSAYLVEYEAQWATVADRYLPASTVDKIFEPFSIGAADRQTPASACRSALHIDLSLSGDNTALALGHVAPFDGTSHIIFDELRSWSPRDEPTGEIDYDMIAAVAVELSLPVDARITMDQYQSRVMKQKINDLMLRAGVSSRRLLQVRPRELTITSERKLQRWELFKTLAAEGCIHAPYDQQAYDELSFLRRVNRAIMAPTSGPATTDDLAEAMSHVVFQLFNDDGAIGARFSQLPVTGVPGREHPLAEALRKARPSIARPQQDNPARGIRR